MYALVFSITSCATTHLGFRAAEVHLLVLVYEVTALSYLSQVLFIHEVFRSRCLLLRAVGTR